MVWQLTRQEKMPRDPLVDVGIKLTVGCGTGAAEQSKDSADWYLLGRPNHEGMTQPYETRALATALGGINFSPLSEKATMWICARNLGLPLRRYS